MKTFFRVIDKSFDLSTCDNVPVFERVPQEVNVAVERVISALFHDSVVKFFSQFFSLFIVVIFQTLLVFFDSFPCFEVEFAGLIKKL